VIGAVIIGCLMIPALLTVFVGDIPEHWRKAERRGARSLRSPEHLVPL
jgi:hypothetical protein